MVQLLIRLYRGYRHVMDEYSDPRTRDWLLVPNPMTLATILTIYLYFCLKTGPRFMKNRKPYELKNALIIYNVFQILLSAYIVIQGVRYGWVGQYSYYCQPIDYANNPAGIAVASACWWYYFAKITELLDTVFFVLRKKNNQVTTLHLYHHVVMPISSWLCVMFFAGGHATLLGWINSIIHVIMYTYYLIAGLGPEYQKYVWWKKHVTALQLIQFCVIFVHNFSVLFRNCNYPKVINTMISIESCVFIYMFGSFYYKNYVRKSQRKEK